MVLFKMTSGSLPDAPAAELVGVAAGGDETCFDDVVLAGWLIAVPPPATFSDG
jgi:hypothetical protein